MTFVLFAREWHQVNQRGWSLRHAHDLIHTLERDVFPQLGRTPTAEIRVRNVLDIPRPIKRRPAPETARRVRQRMSQVLVFTAGMGLLENNPAQVAAGAMVIKRRQPAVTIEEARELLMRVNETPSHSITKLALYLLALIAVRPRVTTSTPWAELSKMDPARPARERDGVFAQPRRLLPSTYAARLAGDFLNSHERNVAADGPIIEMILAHMPEKVSGAYNRARHIERRREPLQIWADLLMDGRVPTSDIGSGRRR